MIRKEAWPFYRTSSGVRLCWVSKNLTDLNERGVLQAGCQDHDASNLKDLNAIRKQKCFSEVLPKEGRDVGLCWEHLNLKDLKDLRTWSFFCSPFYGRACRWTMLGAFKTQRTSRTVGEPSAVEGLMR